MPEFDENGNVVKPASTESRRCHGNEQLIMEFKFEGRAEIDHPGPHGHWDHRTHRRISGRRDRTTTSAGGRTCSSMDSFWFSISLAALILLRVELCSRGGLVCSDQTRCFEAMWHFLAHRRRSHRRGPRRRGTFSMHIIYIIGWTIACTTNTWW